MDYSGTFQVSQLQSIPLWKSLTQKKKKHKNTVALKLKQDVAQAIRGNNASSYWVICIRLLGKPINITHPTFKSILQLESLKKMNWKLFTQVSKKKIDHIPTQDMKILGDWKVKVGENVESNVMGKSGLWVRNDAGYWLVDFCEANNLTNTNTCFKQLTIGHMDITREPIQKSNSLCDWN